ncbi:hypothetical protein B0H19DRAFT_907625, partial [Mycena capillaripes]
FPAIYIALRTVHRFDTFDDIRCHPALYNTIPTYFVSSIQPLVISFVYGICCTLSLRAFAAR